MKPRILIPLLLTSVLLCGCATHARPQTMAVTETSVRSRLDFLASDALNGRGSGTRDEWIAASYIGEQMRRYGIEPLGDDGGYVQTIEMERPEVVASPVLYLGERRLTHGSEVIVQTISGARASAPLQKLAGGASVKPGAALLVPEGTALTAIPNALNAAIVLTRETSAARERWAAAGRAQPRFAPRIVGLSSSVGGRPAIVALNADAYAAAQALTDGTPIRLEAEVKPGPKSSTWNAIGWLRGTGHSRSSEVIVLSAHLDHLGNRPSNASAGADTIFNGADDDASGCVAVLELAEALAGVPRPRRTIVFVFFGSEEGGGYGARSFIERPPMPLTQIVANVEFEMIGRPDSAVAPHTLWLTGYERSNLGPELARHGARLVQDPHPQQNFFERSDNIQLARRGVVAHTVSSYGLHREYHTPADEVRLVDFRHMTEAIQSMVAPIRWLANSDFRPEWRAGKKP